MLVFNTDLMVNRYLLIIDIRLDSLISHRIFLIRMYAFQFITNLGPQHSYYLPKVNK
jgi:hypothetical protein